MDWVEESQMEAVIDRIVSKAIEKNDESWEQRLPVIMSSYEAKVDAKIEASEQRTLEKIGNLEKNFEELKETVKTSIGHISSPSASRAAAPYKSSPLTSANSLQFVPSKVYVQGFYDWKTRTGALSEQEVDALADKLLAGVPAEIRQKFTLTKEHAQSFRLQFCTSDGRDLCWKFREHLAGAILKDNIQVGEKKLTVRVEDAPDVQLKRKHYWSGVDDIKRVGTEDEHFILVPKSFGIHDVEELAPMGYVTEQGYVWNENVMKRALPHINMLDLKKAALMGSRRR